MPRVLLIVAAVLLTIYCVVEVAQAKGYQVRSLPRWLWAFAVICVPVIGPVSWLLLGRPTGKPAQPKRIVAPDDDEDFLRGLR